MQQIIKKTVKTFFTIGVCLVGIYLLAFVTVFIFAPDVTGEVGNRLSVMIGTRIDSVYVDNLKAARGDIVDRNGKVLATGDDRKYPYGELARSVIGAVEPGEDSVALSGIEAAFNKALSGKDGYHIYRTNLRTGNSRKVRTLKPKSGVTVPLSLDIEMQAFVDSIFRAKLADVPGVRNACLVIADVNSGGIRTMVNLSAEEDDILHEGFNTAIAFPFSPGMMMTPATALASCKCDTSIVLGKCDLTSAADLREMFDKCPVQGYLDTLKNLLYGEYCDWHFEIEGRQPIKYQPGVCGDSLSIYRRSSLPCGFGFSGPALSWLRFHTGIARGGEEVALRFVGILLDEDGQIANDMLLWAPGTCNLCTREQASAITASMTQAAAASLGETKYGVAGLCGASFVPYEDGRYNKKDGSRSMQTCFAGFFPSDRPAFSIICMIQTDPSFNTKEINCEVIRGIVNSVVVADRMSAMTM